MNWSLAQAKNQFSEVVRRARSVGPQTISVRGKEEAVVVSKAEYEELRARSGARTFKDLLLKGEPWPDLDLTRDDGRHREVDL